MEAPNILDAILDPDWKIYSPGQTITYSFLTGYTNDYPLNQTYYEKYAQHLIGFGRLQETH